MKRRDKLAFAPLFWRVVGCTLLLQSFLFVADSYARQSSGSQAQAEQIQGEENLDLTNAPNVPPPISRDHPTKVIVHLEVTEVEGQLADGVTYTFWTYGGTVPGKFIRVREGDLVEFHLDNHPNNKMPHNIDLHAVIGPGGGAASSLTAPGHSSVFSFKAIHPGLYVYHCGTAPVVMHVANGMYGLILVEPKAGFPKVDHEYYVMQGEFYTKGKNGEVGEQPFSMEKAIDEKPEYIVFNGSVGSTLGNTALQAKVGETVRLFVGNGGPNLTSSFHVIGEVFDRAWVGGSTSVIETNLQTATVAPGGSAIVDLTVNVPGTFVLVDHALSRAFNRGALAQLKVSGEEDKSVYSGKIRDEVYLPEGAGIKSVDLPGRGAPPARSKAERMERGERAYNTNCAACHQSAGQGIAGAFPPLAKSDFLNADKFRAIETVTGGRQGKLVVNGQEFNGVMPEWTLADEEIANLLTFVYGSWGNSGKEVSAEEVKTHRVKKGGSPE